MPSSSGLWSSTYLGRAVCPGPGCHQQTGPVQFERLDWCPFRSPWCSLFLLPSEGPEKSLGKKVTFRGLVASLKSLSGVDIQDSPARLLIDSFKNSCQETSPRHPFLNILSQMK